MGCSSSVEYRGVAGKSSPLTPKVKYVEELYMELWNLDTRYKDSTQLKV